jgi:hypothetical protein
VSVTLTCRSVLSSVSEKLIGTMLVVAYARRHNAQEWSVALLNY